MGTERQEYPYPAKCHRCFRSIQWAASFKQPVLCGRCQDDIFNAAGAVAVDSYAKGMRDG